MFKKVLWMISLLVSVIFIGGCTPGLVVSGLSVLATGAVEGMSSASKAKSEENINKENNTSFAQGVATEQSVRSILDPNGKPDDELLFQDVTPAKKILVYERKFTSGKGYRVLLFAFNQQKNQFIFWDQHMPSENGYLNFKQDKGSNKYFKAGWYVDTLQKQIDEYEKKGQHNIASGYVNKLLEQKCEFEDINAEANNSAAWFLATCKDPRFRDTDKAMEYAQKAVEIVKKLGNLHNIASYLDTLAATCAEKGDFEKAVEVETEAYNMALDKNSGVSLESLNSFKELIEVYRSRRTYAQWKYGEKLTSK